MTTEFTVSQVLGWDASGTITFNDMSCTHNSVAGNGGCFHGSGKSVFGNGTRMLDNYAEHGGSICKPRIYYAPNKRPRYYHILRSICLIVVSGVENAWKQ